MAVVAINIDPDLYKLMAARVREGRYLDLEQFFDVAARNQLALEATPQQLLRSSYAEPPADDVAARRPSGSAEVKRRAADDLVESSGPRGDWLPLVMRVQLPIDRFAAPDVDSEIDHLLWGQTNRLLPVAVGVRVLANLLGDFDDVSVASWHDEATAVATALRDDLHRSDARANRAHGTRWATAFPESKESSAQRYVNQFLGAPARDGRSEGGAVFLGLVAISGSGNNARATLTRSGALWASLANPIFDANGAEPQRTFSEEETRFFLEHLREFRVGEYRFLNTVASLVAEGLSREQQNEAIARAYPRWDSVASTMRAGAIGRLGDLGLLERSRHGLNVEYRLTPLAATLGLPQPTEVVGL